MQEIIATSNQPTMVIFKSKEPVLLPIIRAIQFIQG